MAPRPKPVLERLMARTRVSESGCWIWTGAASGSNSPYGGITWGGRGTPNVGVHRASARLFLGLHENDERFVLHRCDTPRCWRPDHLYLGDHADNMRDLANRGRGRSGKQKLTPEQVQEIKDAISRGGRNMDIADRFNVSRHHISGIRHGRYWK